MYKIIQVSQKNNFAADLSTALYNIDPAGTMCVANSNHDEYNSIALQLSQINGTFVTSQMLMDVMGQWFGDECEAQLTSAETVAAMAAFFTTEDGYIFSPDIQTYDTIGVTLPDCIMNDVRNQASAEGKTVGGFISELVSSRFK